MLALREYQRQALEAEARHRVEHPDETRLAIVMATGLGKGMIIGFRAVSFAETEHDRVTRAFDCGVPLSEPRDRVLILTHTDELVSDLAARARLIAKNSEFSITVGVVKAERDETDADIIIGSVQTLANPERRARIQDVGLVLVDECHHATAASYQAIMRHFGCFPHEAPETEGNADYFLSMASTLEAMDQERGVTPALGFTATLERGDGQGLGEIWQDVAYSKDVAWGVRKGYLVQPIGHRLEIEGLDFDRTLTGKDVSPYFADQAMRDGIAPEKIVEKWLELAKGRPTVAFMPLVRSAKALRDAFEDAGVVARTIHGDMAKELRRIRLEGYESGKIQVLVNAMVLTEGWDSPRTKCVIVGRPTKSRSLFVQMAGRGLRPVPGVPVEDQDCILITVADATTDLCSIADLSDRPLDRKLQGALTAMEDEWNIGKELDEQAQAKLWTGHVDARQFDPLVTRSSKVWRATEHGTPFLPISKDGEYVFIVGTSVWMRAFAGRDLGHRSGAMRATRLHKDLPDLELAMTLAEQEAEDRGGDLGRLLADRSRAWRNQRPSDQMLTLAVRLGLEKHVEKIMSTRAGGKAGKVSDLISKVVATRALEPMVGRIKEATS